MSGIERLLKALADSHANFIVVGAYAAILQGSSLRTDDLDICYERTPDNYKKIIQAIAASAAGQETGTTPVSYFRIYNPELVRDFKVRAVELDRYLQYCWEEAVRVWLSKEKPVSPATDREDKSEPKLIGIRMDPGLAQKLKVRAARLSRPNGDCLEEAGIDWLRKNRARGKERP